MARRAAKQQQYPWEQIEGATGASDATSGGGAGAGTPEPETVERSGGRVLRGNVARDKKRIFPERFAKAAARKSTAARKGKTASRGGAARRSATAKPKSSRARKG
jgi:hypothetical protein